MVFGNLLHALSVTRDKREAKEKEKKPTATLVNEKNE